MIHCLISEAQIMHDKNTDRVSEPVEVYRAWRIDMVKCDSLRKEDAKDIAIKDSIINDDKKEIKALNDLVSQKDTTIKHKDITIKEYKGVAEKAIKDSKCKAILKQPLLYIIVIATIIVEELMLR